MWKSYGRRYKIIFQKKKKKKKKKKNVIMQKQQQKKKQTKKLWAVGVRKAGAEFKVFVA